ncbi:MAG: FMN-dependent NADH-azoreductase [Pseudomonadales bacterium]
MNLLVINSSPSGETSATRAMNQIFSEQLKAHTPALNIIERDLRETALAPPSEAVIGAFYTPPEARSEAQASLVALSDTLIDELEAADVIAIGAPMHNFGVSSQLKCYIDHIARVGRTFQYTENGPQGLLENKKVFVFCSSGGDYSHSPMAALDQLTPYLKTVLGFIGISDVSFSYCAGITSPESQADALAQVKGELEQHASALAR